MKPTDSDIFQVQQLMALWGHVLDDRDWDRLGELLTEDAVYDGSVFGYTAIGTDDIRAMLRDGEHAVAHLSTNVLVLEGPGDELRVVSKGLGLLDGGLGSAVNYHDELVPTEDGWRISKRVLKVLDGKS